MIKYNELNRAGRLAVFFMVLCLLGLPALLFPSHSNFDLEGKTVEHFKGTFIHAEFFKGGGVKLLTKSPETRGYQAFYIEGLSILTNSDSLVSGRSIELTHLEKNVLTCQINGVLLCTARCSSAASCIELERSDTDMFVKIALIILFVFAIFFAVLSWLQHLRGKQSDVVKS
ncbi:hypothetical protein [Pseudomonas gingeri]|uniref:Uncharacterized protein n=1 Tax=Pseudomonas gingeri TaxID=117681 RepID=A0A7Y7WAC6_9PSED|nr:hypothetical protein [Pseudomonas gingeri]NWB45682.1 hypothetical protein [Pseudomonas gingeri]